MALHHDPLVPDFGMDLTSVVAVANRLVNATDDESGVAREDVLEEVQAFAPGLLRTKDWREMYAGLAREQRAIGSMFE